MNTERYGVSLCIQSECGKMRSNITPNTETFHAVTLAYFIMVLIGAALDKLNKEELISLFIEKYYRLTVTYKPAN